MQTAPHLIESAATRPSRRSLRQLAATVMLAGALTAGLGLTAASASAAGCDYVAATSGSDAAPGSAAAPFRSVQHLVDQLSAGQTGCVRAGSYSEDVRFNHGGELGAPVTLTSYPGDVQSTIVGRMFLPSGSDYVTVSSLNLNGVNAGDLPSPTIDDTGASFINDDVTDHNTAICYALGSNDTWVTANDALIQGNRIHECGKLPAANHDHAIYIDVSNNARILNNVIFDNADRGVQLYPDAQGTVIKGNVIDSNGEGILFSGDFGVAANHNVVENNVITNSTLRNNVESWYPGGNPVGQGNVVTNNCISGGAHGATNGGVDTSNGGFSAANNLIADPHYANPGARDYTVSPSSPCAAILAGAPAPAPPPAPAPSPPGSPTPPGGTSPGGTSPGGTGTKPHHHVKPAHSARAPAKLALNARLSRRSHLLLVHGRIASALLNQSRQVVVLTRIGRHWRVVGYRMLSQRSTFTLNLHVRRTALRRGIGVRAKVVGIAYQTTIFAHVH